MDFVLWVERSESRRALLVFLPRPLAGEMVAAPPALPTCTPQPGRQKKVVIPAKFPPARE